MIPKNKWLAVTLLPLALAPCIVGAVWVNGVWTTYRLTQHAARHDDPTIRRDALYELGKQRARAAGAVMKQALADASHADVREAAAYALYKSEADGAASAIRAAVDQQADGVHRAKMLVYLARLRGDAIADTLQTWTREGAAWLAVGAALARIELGDVEAGAWLLARLHGADAFSAAHITDSLQPTLAIMMELIGRPIDLTVTDAGRWTPSQVIAIENWWRQHATPALLGDALRLVHHRTSIRRDLARLEGAQQRAVRYLGLE